MSPEATVGPIEAGERLALLDVLRGFALGGVFVANAFLFFSGWVLLPRAQVEAWQRSPVEATAQHLFSFLVAGKAMTVFGFLFGLGFSLLLLRAEARGVAVVPLYRRRLAVLFGFGLTHIFALWYGDILAVYALAGAALLLFRNQPTRRLVALALLLIFVWPVLVALAERLVPLLLHSREEVAAAAKAAGTEAALRKVDTLEAFAAGSYLRVVSANARYYLNDFIGPRIWAYFGIVLGKFLLGLVVGRMGLLRDVPGHRALLRRVLGWGLALGLLGNGAALAVRLLLQHKVLPMQSPWLLLLSPVRELGDLALAAFYVAAIALAFQRPRGQRLLSLLAPAGRMALTNYLMQSVIGLLVFYGLGLGLIGKLPPSRSLPLLTALYLGQVALSHLWLAFFRFGPAEWLWRSLTYGQRQPLLRAQGVGARQPG